MNTIETKPDLKRWDVPFAGWHEMSVWTIAEGDFENFSVVVAPLSEKHPKENYPKYLIRFERIIAFFTCDEATLNDRYGGHLSSLTGWVYGQRAYDWVSSPWAKSSQGYADFMRWKPPNHYLILGDDSIVEVVTSAEPKIEIVQTKRVIEVKYEV